MKKNNKIDLIINSINRSDFIPYSVQNLDINNALPIGFGQTIPRVSTVKELIIKLKLEPDETVLEIGTGSGYNCYVLSHLCKLVFSIEKNPTLAVLAKENIKKYNRNNILLKCDDGLNGWIENSPFDKILVTTCLTYIPNNLINQLKENGVIVFPLRKGSNQELIQLKKVRGTIIKTILSDKLTFVYAH